MAAAGKQAEEILDKSKRTVSLYSHSGRRCSHKERHGMIAGKEMLDILKEFSAPAVAILAVGSCATFGGVPAANPIHRKL